MKYLRILLIFLLLPSLALAEVAPGFLDDPSLAKCMSSGDCQLADIAQGFILLIKLLLGGMGAVALLYFVIGGLQWLTSQGNQEKIRKGQQTMINTVIALAIAFSSYLILNFFVNDILKVKSYYTIGDGGVPGQCEGKSDETACNVVAGSTAVNPYACFSGECISKCAMKVKKNLGNWSCYNVENPDLLTSDVTAYWEKNICPGDEHKICFLLNSSGDPSLFDDPAYQAMRNLLGF